MGDTQNDNIYVSSAANSWVIFSRVDTIIAGEGLKRSGNTLNIVSNGVKNHMIPNYELSWLKITNGTNAESVFGLTLQLHLQEGSIGTKLTLFSARLGNVKILQYN